MATPINPLCQTGHFGRGQVGMWDGGRLVGERFFPYKCRVSKKFRLVHIFIHRSRIRCNDRHTTANRFQYHKPQSFHPRGLNGDIPLRVQFRRVIQISYSEINPVILYRERGLLLHSYDQTNIWISHFAESLHHTGSAFTIIMIDQARIVDKSSGNSGNFP